MKNKVWTVVFFITIMTAMEAAGLFPFMTELVSTSVLYTYLLSFVAATIVCLIIYLGYLHGLAKLQRDVIPRLDKYKSDLKDPRMFAIITIAVVVVYDIFISYMLFVGENTIITSNLLRLFFMACIIIPTIGLIQPSIIYAKANRDPKYTDEDFEDADIHQEGLNDGKDKKALFYEKDGITYTYSNAIIQKTQQFDTEITKKWDNIHGNTLTTLVASSSALDSQTKKKLRELNTANERGEEAKVNILTREIDELIVKYEANNEKICSVYDSFNETYNNRLTFYMGKINIYWGGFCDTYPNSNNLKLADKDILLKIAEVSNPSVNFDIRSYRKTNII